MNSARAFFLTLAFSAAAIPAFAAQPAWDNSGNSMVSGTYYFRQVLYIADESGNTSEATSLFGNVTFTPSTGTYSMTGLNYADSSNGAGPTNSISGTYSVSSSGFGILSDPLVTGANVEFLVANHIVIGSATESGYNDMLIAAPVGSLSNASFSGGYTINGFFPGGSLASILDATYQLSPNGAGQIGNVSITGHSASGPSYSQNSTGVKYNFVNGANVITFPTNNNNIFYSGQVYMYMSPDGNFVFGGSPTGYDMFVGVRNAGSGTSTPLTNGLYYEAGLDANANVGIDSFYGSFNVVGSGNLIEHQRLAFSESGQAVNSQGETLYDSYPTTISNTYQSSSGITQYTIGQGGIRIAYGLAVTSGAFSSIAVAMPYTPPGATGSVYLDPTGIVNSASSAPYTAGISPGEFMTIYGSNLAGSTAVSTAFPTSLGGVQVILDGVITAPLYFVSASQISFLVPYEVSSNNYTVASIQVVNNNVKSNVATTYVYQTTPGVFTANPVGGYGIAAMLDFPSSGGYFVVSTAQPANPGDPVALYLTGLGNPFPSNPDGALGPSSGDSLANGAQVDISGTNVGNFAYSGLAPALAGLYQINFTMPTLCGSPAVQPCINAGLNTLGVTGIAVSGATSVYDSYSNEAVVPVSSGGTTASDRTPADGAELNVEHPAAARPRQRPHAAVQAKQSATQ